MAIEILPARLANQIAAGEVVERPASVIKELVENSLDAGATSIKIDIEKGGAKCIRIADNGKGIPKDELTLALSRHATSKIKDLNDLEAISSLGFRGEALASISSVSRLTLTSKPEDQSSAWQACAEGRDMAVDITPAAHPDGTTIEVNDLFFNTPARRKFLRTEKTEFTHIEEVVRRIALAHFNVGFVLTHNGKVVRQYRAARNQSQNAKRVAQICGQKFIEHAVEIECQHGELRLWGWLAKPDFYRNQNDLTYSYVNGRMMRDKLINHAIRQAYANYLPSETYPAFVLFLELDHKEVDVNVHPAKHEVRFHQGRYIHDFILSVCQDGLHNTPVLSPENQAFSENNQPEYSSQDVNEIVGVQDTKASRDTTLRNSNSVYQVNQDNIEAAQTINSQRAIVDSIPVPQSIRYNTDYIKPLQHVADQQANFSSTHNVPAGNNHIPQGGRSLTSKSPVSKSGVSAYQHLLSTPYSSEEEVETSQIEDRHKLDKQNDENVHVISVVDKKFAVVKVTQKLRLASLMALTEQVNIYDVINKIEVGMVSQPLLLPIKLSVTKTQLALIEGYSEQWQSVGIHIQKLSNSAIQVRQFPALLRHKDVTQSLSSILAYIESFFESNVEQSLNDASSRISAWGNALAISLASGDDMDACIESAQALLNRYQNQCGEQFIPQLLLNSVEIDLTSAIKQLK